MCLGNVFMVVPEFATSIPASSARYTLILLNMLKPDPFVMRCRGKKLRKVKFDA